MLKDSNNFFAPSLSGFVGNFSLAVAAAALVLAAPATFAAGSAKAAEKATEKAVEKAEVAVAKESSKQSESSTFTAYKLDIVGSVEKGGTDKASSAFDSGVLPGVSHFLSEKLGERAKVDDSSYLLDPSKLNLKTAADVRVYFIGEGAGYASSLGFNTEAAGVNSGNPLLIFPNASSAISTEDYVAKAFRLGAEAQGNGKADPKGYAYGLSKHEDAAGSLDKLRSMSTPLLPGDFVDLGDYKAGTTLDFFLIANGANGGKNVYSTDTSMNPDGINHVVSFAYAMKDSPYLILGFEDLYGGGDRDFNDLLFAVDIGAVNVSALTGTPEPGTWAILGCFVGLGVCWKRRLAARSVSAQVA